jgi:hypothetical protein
MRGEAERVALVSSIVSPVQAEGAHVGEEVMAQGGDEWKVRANSLVYSQGEGAFREVLVSGFVHGACFASDDLAGHSEGFARSCGGFVEFDASVIICLGGEDERVDLIAELDGELEEWAVGLGVHFL